MSRPVRGRPPSIRTSTTKLPTALRSELGLGVGDDAAGPSNARVRRAELFRGLDKGKRSFAQASRKDQRRAKRQGVKDARSQHSRDIKDARRSDTQKPHSTHDSDKKAQSNTKARSSTLQVTRPEPEKIAARVSATAHKSTRAAEPTQRKHVLETTRTPLQRLLDHTQPADATLDARPLKKRKALDDGLVPRSGADAEDERIALLETLLGQKGGKASKSGLDGLLGDFDRLYPDSEQSEDDRESELDEADSDFSDAESTYLLSDTESEPSEDDEASLSGEDGAESESGGVEVDINEIRPKGAYTTDLATSLRHIDNNDEDPRSLMESSSPTKDLSSEQRGSAAPGRYIPPALRETQDDEEPKLRRQAKGQLNRLGENNLEGILSEVEKLFRDYSRAKVTQILTSLIIDTIKASEDVTDALTILYATLAACLHRVVGVEYAAHFVQTLTDELIRAIERVRRETSSTPTSAHGECRNLAGLLAASYNLGIIACPLVYDVVKVMMRTETSESGEEQSAMTEVDIDILLRIVKMCGSQLRHDDKDALQSIVNTARTRLRSASSSRARFMLDSLQDLSSSRSRSTTSSVAQEQIVKMRKFIGGLDKRRTLRTHQPLRVTLNDLQTADKRGKWWLVGAAWAGYDFDKQAARQQSALKSSVQKSETNSERKAEDPQSDTLLALAKEHGMNTVLRQQIFVILLSSQDFLDAVQRLLGLTSRKSSQRKEIVRVLVHCIGREPIFNPYYVVVGARLAREDEKATRITMQYCLWDFLRQLGETSVGGRSIIARNGDADDDDGFASMSLDSAPDTEQNARINNVARTFGWWIAKGALGLEALRPIDFVSLTKPGRRFLQLLIIYVLLGAQVTSPAQMLSLPPLKEKSRTFPISEASSAEDKISLPSSITTDVESIFVRGTRSNQRIAQGLVIFFERHLKARKCISLTTSSLGMDDNSTKRLVAARNIATETVRVGSQVAARDDVEFDE